MTYIKTGHGFNVGQDFARAKEDTPIEIDCERAGYVYGYIAGDPSSSLGFMRHDRIRVQVRKDCTIER